MKKNANQGRSAALCLWCPLKTLLITVLMVTEIAASVITIRIKWLQMEDNLQCIFILEHELKDTSNGDKEFPFLDFRESILSQPHLCCMFCIAYISVI